MQVYAHYDSEGLPQLTLDGVATSSIVCFMVINFGVVVKCWWRCRHVGGSAALCDAPRPKRPRGFAGLVSDPSEVPYTTITYYGLVGNMGIYCLEIITPYRLLTPSKIMQAV